MRRLLYFFFCFFSVFQVTAQEIITTVAGDGTAGAAGDGGPATVAELYTPFGQAMDAAGNIYIADALNNKVRIVNPSGVISTFAGTGGTGFSGDGGPASAATIQDPMNVAIDASGNIYIGDAGNHRLRIVNTSGIISTFAGNGSTIYSGDGGPASAAGVGSPTGIAFDGSGNVYICADGVHVRKVNSSGIISTFAGTTIGFSGDGGPATLAQLYNPTNVAVDIYGDVLIADQLNNRVRRVNASGIISTIAGTGTGGYTSDGVPATSSELNNPYGITTDAMGNYYISDHLNNRVRKVNTSGIISTVAGTGAAGYSGDWCAASAAQINTHWAISTDGSGNVYIADGGNNRVREISPNHAPYFTGGHSQYITTTCGNPTDSLDTLLAIVDSDYNQGETWIVLTPPVHGTAAASYSAISDGGLITPAGLYYQVTPGYNGSDSFTIVVYDCALGSDTTHIYITDASQPDTTHALKDTTACEGTASIMFSAPAGYTSYSWNTGATTLSISVDSPGYYWVTAAKGCSLLSDTFGLVLIAHPQISLGNDTTICTGESVTLSPTGASGSIYHWSTGSTADSITVAAAGTYSLTITNEEGCSGSASVSVALTSLSTFSLGPDTTVCAGDKYVLNSGMGNAVWNTGATGANITVTESGTYWATVTNQCGSVTDSAKVEFVACFIAFPSAFTPNGDNLNDLAQAVGDLSLVRDYALSIYNRWGQRVYYTNDVYAGWDGTLNGVKQDVGTYYYMLTYSLESKSYRLKGDITLIR